MALRNFARLRMVQKLAARTDIRLNVVQHGANAESYFKEMRRILKPGGLLVASTDCRQTPMQLGPTFLRRSHPCVYREGGSERASSRQTKQFRHDWTDRPLLYRELGRD